MPQMNGEKEELKLLENIVTELQHIKQALQATNAKIEAEISVLNAISMNGNIANMKLDQIIQNTTPVPSDDVVGFKVSVDKPTNQ